VELLNDNESKQKLIDAYARQVREDPTGKQIIEKYSGRTSSDNKSKDGDITNLSAKSEHRWEATFLQQISILTERTFKQSSRVILNKINLAQTLALTFVCCVVWFRMPYLEISIYDRTSNVSTVHIIYI
jgi:hypothetical protein